MEKRVWENPLTMVQQFVPNEYVAACGDSGTSYLFTCDAGGGKTGTVYLETNDRPGLQTGRGGDQYLSGYHACGTTHEADSDDEFLKGYYVTEEYVGFWPFGHYETTTTDVIVWRGPWGDNTHCTTNLNQDSWETAKS